MPLTETQQDIERVLLLDTDSRSLPDLPNKKGKTNWVEKSGGLPSYIERIAKHLHSEKGMTVSRAIATAVNTVKKWCAGGDDVTAATKAKACKAVEQWEAKKAKSKSNLSVGPLPGEGKERLVVVEGVFLSASDAEFLSTLDVMVLAQRDLDAFDAAKYALALSAVRQLDLAVTFDPSEHPRDYRGLFKKKIGGLAKLGTVKLPDGVEVTAIDVARPGSRSARDRRYNVRMPDGTVSLAKNPEEASDKALKGSSSAGKPGELPDSLAGGEARNLGPKRIGAGAKKLLGSELGKLLETDSKGDLILTDEQMDRIEKAIRAKLPDVRDASGGGKYHPKHGYKAQDELGSLLDSFSLARKRRA